MNLINKQYNSRPGYSHGFSIVELMVALVISLILLGGISQIFLSSKKSFTIQESLGRQQENGRFILETVGHDVRRAGFLGGIGLNPIVGTIGETADNGTCPTSDNSWGRMLDNRIFGLNDTNAGYACIPDADYLRGDVLVMRYQAPWLVGGMITPTIRSPEDNDRLYLRSSLTQARLFKGSQAAVASNALATVTGGTAELIARAYYIGSSSSGNCNGVVVPALYRETLNASGQPVAEEIAFGVENLQVQYGVDTNNDDAVDRYLNAGDTDLNESDEWQSVITVQLSVLTRAECPETGLDTTGTTYTMGDVTYNPGDTAGRGFRRQLYETTITLRNARR